MEHLTVRQSNSVDATILSRYPILVALLAAVVMALLCLSLANPASADDDDDDDGGEFVSRQVVVKFKPGVTKTGVAAFNKKFETRTQQVLPGGEKIYLLRITQPGVKPSRLVVKMQGDARVIYAEPNFRAGLPEASRRHSANSGGKPNTESSGAPQYRSQYAANNLNLAEAHTVNRGTDTTVAVIDTGIQSDHPEFAQKTVQGYDFVGMDDQPEDVGDGRNNDFDGETDEMVGHGTHVSGAVLLAAPETKIMPIRALDSEGRGTTFGIAKAIKFATRRDADVVNLSLGSSRSTELLDDLTDDGGGARGTPPVFVAAAGNDANAVQQFPAAEEDAIAVASVGESKTKSDFSNFSDEPHPEGWVDIAAPGADIHAPFTQSQYAMWSGTSMATPFVAGQAALIRHERPGAHAECVAGIIANSADTLDDKTIGAGHADVAASTTYAADKTDPAKRCSVAGDDD